MYTFKIEFINGSSTPVFDTLEDAKRCYDYYLDAPNVLYISRITKLKINNYREDEI